MVKKSRLRSALDAHQGKDYRLERQKTLQKQAQKKKRKGDGGTSEADQINEREEESGSEWGGVRLDGEIDTSQMSDSKNGVQDGKGKERIPDDIKAEEGDEDEDEDEDEDDEEGDIALSDVGSMSSEQSDIVPHQRLTINNTTALLRSLNSISNSNPSINFSAYQSVTSSEPTNIPDPNEDLSRELAFYKQSLEASKIARKLLEKEGVPFSRPHDYFAEMVKSDEHMGTVKGKLVADAADKKAAAEARKQRDLKRFGKQVQVAKMQERDKAKRETLEKIQLLKRKRQADTPTAPNEDDLFDVALESASKPDKQKRGTSSSKRDGSKRQKRDQKFGYGGKKRFSKSGDAASTADLTGFSARKMKGGPKRLGKSRRKKAV
ncbi:MAG: rRNA-processing protein and EBNA1-binding protein ebp2 [Piccolia ochrophora]|nr:MAG: rRNA-processing protein and EBNA1-binding protein ebp2 [Piccolia ochrophora]